MEKKMTFKKLFVSLMILVVVFAGFPISGYAASDDITVRVIAENNTFSVADGAPWEGVLFTKDVTVSKGESAMDAIVKAIEEANVSQTGAENNYIEEIGGLAAFDGGFMSGWMGTINDWFCNAGFGDFVYGDDPTSDFYLAPGSVIDLVYTLDYGEDCGGSWNNSDNTIKSVSFSTGSLNESFDKATHSYTLTVPAGTTSVKVTPTASNKNYQVKTSIGSTYYGRLENVPVVDGTVITVECGNPAWPTMNMAPDSGEVYTFTVEIPTPEVTVDVTLSSQSYNVFTVTPKKVTVSSKLSDTYGYVDQVTSGVSALDALIKSYEIMLGDEFTTETAHSYLEVSSTGSVTMLMGEPSYSFGYAVNDQYPYDENSEYGSYGYTGYMVNQAELHNNDTVSFFEYWDSMWMDYLVWFNQNGEKVTEITAKEGQEITLNMEGFVYMFGSYTKEDLEDMMSWGPIEGAQIVTSDVNGNFTEVEGAITDEDGNVTFTLPAGTTYISAVGDEYTTIVSPWIKATIIPEVKATVTISSQSYNVFTITPKEVEVSSLLSDKYGYVDQVTSGVSALDALIKAYEIMLGDDFTVDTAHELLEVGETGYVTMLMGEPNYSFGFAINDRYPYDPESEYGSFGYTGYSLNQAALNDGDSVAFFEYWDSMWMDYLVWFNQNGEKVTEITAKEGQEITLNMEGFVYMFGSYTKEDLEDMMSWGPIEGAQIVTSDVNGNFTEVEGAITDEDGNVTFTLPAGTTYISAVGNEYTTIVSPWIKAEIEEDPFGITGLIIRTSTSTSNLNNAILAGENSVGVAVFDSATKTYDLGNVLTDSTTQLRFWYTIPEAGTVVTAYWGETGSKVLTNASNTKLSITNVFANCVSAGENEIKLVITPKAGSNYSEKTYTIKFNAVPTLTGLTATANGTDVYLDKAFASTTNEYTLTVPNDKTEVTFNATPKSGSYEVKFNGSESNIVDVANLDSVTILVTANGVTNEYVVAINKVESGNVTINVTPTDAIVNVFDGSGNKVEKNSDGTYSGMFSAYEYTYVATKYGYIAKTGIIPADATEINLILDEASQSSLENVSSEWANFRNSEYNMAISNAKTPIKLDDTELLWAAKLGSGWSAAPSIQIIVDDAIICMSGSNLYKLNKETGEVLAQAALAAGSGYGYTPMTYAEGMIFCPLQSGTIQAFNAKTLESLWVYKDKLGGQSLSPITYSDGYIYTGWWNSEVKDANFSCISVTDEDPTKTNEEKLATWQYKVTGGFYWAGSIALGDYIVVGTDDGTSGTAGDSTLYSFNKYTGEVVSSIKLTGMGDQRSTMAYSDGKVYFTTKGGYLASAEVNTQTGELSNLKAHNNNAQSTSTPVVYKGIVYYGAGSGISSTGSSGNLIAADADTLEMLYAVGLKGYPQCSMLLSTAYEEETGKIYIYSTYNNNPGGISMIETTADNRVASGAKLVEIYDATGYAQYCITSIICDNDGNLYYKNDSGNVLKVGVPLYKKTVNLIDEIGEVTLESEEAITGAREAYDALSEEDQAKVTNYETLVEAEKELAILKGEAKIEAEANAVEDLINAIGTVTLNSESKIKAARAAYDALSDEAKAKVDNVTTLTNAEKKLKELKNQNNNPSGNTTTPGDVTIGGDNTGDNTGDNNTDNPLDNPNDNPNPGDVIDPNQNTNGDLPDVVAPEKNFPVGWVAGGAGLLTILFIIFGLKKKKEDK